MTDEAPNPLTGTVSDDDRDLQGQRLTNVHGRTGSGARAPVSSTRLSAAWTAVTGAVLVLTLVVIFTAENTAQTSVTLFGFHGHAPTGVLLLAALILGAAVVLAVGAARILQLRRLARSRTTSLEPTTEAPPPVQG